jgi:hypothetical protein
MRAQNKEICNTIRYGKSDRSRALIVSSNSGQLCWPCPAWNAMSQNVSRRDGRLVKWPERHAAAGNYASFALRRMPRVQIFWHILFLLRRHFGGVRLARNPPRTKQSSRDIVLAQTRLSIIELAVASVT